MAFTNCLFCYRLNNFPLSDIIQVRNEVNGCDIVNNPFRGGHLAKSLKLLQFELFCVLLLFENADIR